MVFQKISAFNSRRLVDNTLRLIDPEFSDSKYQILNYASPKDKAKIGKVHLDTNLNIKKCLEDNSLGECVHITGRMSALNDPFHADLCTNIFRKTENPFKFSYFDQEEPDVNPVNIVRQKRIMWRNLNWKHSVSALRKEANSQIEAYAVRQPTTVQYTIFGNRFVQLQSKHNDDGGQRPQKHVWLIESERVHDLLRGNAEGIISRARHVSPNLFRDAYQLVAGLASKSLLSQMKTGSPYDVGMALDLASDFHHDPAQVLQVLQEFDFVSLEGDQRHLRITRNGKELLEAIA